MRSWQSGPSNPGTQLQKKVPATLAHDAPLAHGVTSVLVHSSMSEAQQRTSSEYLYFEEIYRCNGKRYIEIER